MSKLVFTPSADCFSASDEVMLKAFKRHLHAYKVASLDGVAQSLLDCAYDLFHIVQTQGKSIKELEIKLRIRQHERDDENDERVQA
ncbi:MAG: hypothetical protein ACFNYB_06465 [Campylobacter sp.]